MSRVPLALMASLVVLVGACGPFPEPPPVNTPPVARVVWPQLWRASDPVPFDASGSEDPEGTIDVFRLIFGDGSEAQENGDGVFDHLYGAAGSYDFQLRVIDEGGMQATVLGTVVVVDTLDDPACTCERPCFEPATCTTTGCFLVEHSDDEEAPVALPGDAVPCDE